MHPYFYWLGKEIPAYGLLLVAGVLVANGCAYVTCRRRRLEQWQVFVLEGYALLGGMLGAKLLYLMVSFDEIDWSAWRNLRYVSAIMSGGFVFYGGLIGGMAACFWAGKIHHIPTARIFPKLVYTLPLAHGFGRIGCLLAGCCYGVPYDGLFAVSYPLSVYGQDAALTYFPIQALEALCLWLLALIVFRVSNEKEGYLPIAAYLLGYGILRFALEFFRGDGARGRIGVFSVSQWVSLVIIAVVCCVSFFRTQKTKEHL